MPSCLNDKVPALDAAWRQMAARLEEAGEDALVSVVTPAGGRARLSVENLGGAGESESPAWLRATCQAMLPRIDLPDGSTGAYGVLDAIARNKVAIKKVVTRWPDMVRVAGSLVTKPGARLCPADLSSRPVDQDLLGGYRLVFDGR